MSDETVDPGAERAFYQQFAWAYDLLITRPGGPQIDNVSTVLRERGCETPAHLIDAGCGTGVCAVALSLLGFVVTAVDRSSELLDAAQRRARESDATVSFAQSRLDRGLVAGGVR